MLRECYERCLINHKSLPIIALAFGLTIPVAALAQSVSVTSSSGADSASLVQRLQEQERMDEFKAKFWSQEPLTQQDYYVQEKQDRHLVAKISAGQPVSSAEIEQALQRVDTEY